MQAPRLPKARKAGVTAAIREELNAAPTEERNVHMETEELYLNIINNLRDGIYFVDTERRILFWNKAAEQITGYSAEEIVGKRCQDSRLNHIDEAGRPLCAVGCPLFATLGDGQQRQDREGEAFLQQQVRFVLAYSVQLLINCSQRLFE